MKTFSNFLESQLDEENKPTSPEKWAKAKAAAKSKFSVYPSAYANAWAAKKYKAMGGGWETANEDVEAQFDLIEEVIEQLAFDNNIDPEYIWERLESFTDEELLEYAVDAKGHKSSTGGLTQKGRDAYNAKGANLKAPVTTPPSKLKKGSKAANRRKSFCARMGGMEGPMKKPNGEPTRKALALRKWNC